MNREPKGCPKKSREALTCDREADHAGVRCINRAAGRAWGDAHLTDSTKES